MKDLLIIGAGGFGREVFGFAIDNPNNGREYRVKGFLDSRRNALGGFVTMAGRVEGLTGEGTSIQEKYRREVGVVGDPKTYAPGPDDVFVCALGDPRDKIEYAQPILDKGGRFINLLHPWAAVSVYMRIGVGCIVAPFASISCDTQIGNFVVVNGYAGIGHDVQIGDWCEIDGHCLIAGGVQIGAFAKVHAGAVILPGKKVGAGATIGAGSVVVANVPEGETVFGNPAKKLSWKAQGRSARAASNDVGRQ